MVLEKTEPEFAGGDLMKNIYLAMKLLLKNKIFSILIIVNIVISSTFLFPLLSEYINFRRAKATVERMEIQNVHYIYTSLPYTFDSYLYNAFHDKAAKTGYIVSVGEVYQLFETSYTYTLWFYNETIIDHFSPFLAKGEWFAEYENQSTTRIPAVVAQGAGYKTGDFFSMEIVSYDSDKKEIILPVDCVVIGVLDSPTQYLDMQGGAANEYFTLDFLLGSETNTIILPLTPEIHDFADPYLYWCVSAGYLMFTEPGVDYEAVKKDFGYYGEVTDMSSGKSRFYTDMNWYLMSAGYYLMIYSIIAIIGVTSLNIIQNIRNRKNFTVYYLTGMSRKQCAAIELTRMFTLMLLSMLAVIAYSMYSGDIRIFERGQYITALLTLLSYVAIVFIPASIGFIIGNIRYNIIDAVKQLFLDR